jgi:hypothetical protein
MKWILLHAHLIPRYDSLQHDEQRANAGDEVFLYSSHGDAFSDQPPNASRLTRAAKRMLIVKTSANTINDVGRYPVAPDAAPGAADC